MVVAGGSRTAPVTGLYGLHTLVIPELVPHARSPWSTQSPGVRFGKPFLLAFQKFSGKEAIGEPLKINLDHGDVYVMSEAAVQGKADGKYKIKHCAGNKEGIGFE